MTLVRQAQIEEIAERRSENQKQRRLQRALYGSLPEEAHTKVELEELMRDPRYGSEPEYTEAVQSQFARSFPGVEGDDAA